MAVDPSPSVPALPLLTGRSEAGFGPAPPLADPGPRTPRSRRIQMYLRDIEGLEPKPRPLIDVRV